MADRSDSLPQGLAQVGRWSAILSGLLALGWTGTVVLQTIVAPPRDWAGIEAFARSYRAVELLNFVPSLPLASAFLVLMVCVYFYAPATKRLWAMLGLTFTLVYMSLAMLFAAWVFEPVGLQRWIRWSFVAVGVTAPVQFAGVLLQLGLVVGAPAGLIWSIGTPLACFALAVLFKRVEPGG